MLWIALKMLIGDTGKFLGLVFGVAFASVLILQQASIFVGIMKRTSSMIRDIREADIWVYSPDMTYLDTVQPLRDIELERVRSIPGVEWALPLVRNATIAKPLTGRLSQVTLLGVDETALVGIPQGKLIAGKMQNIYLPDAVFVDEVGYHLMWPDQPIKLGKVMELNDKRAVLYGVVNARPSFTFQPIIYTLYNRALNYAPGGRKRLSYILVHAQEGVNPYKLSAMIRMQTHLKAVPSEVFSKMTMAYYLANTAIPINFGTTVILGLVVAAAIVGLLMYMFVSENIKQFGALKAMGLGNLRLLWAVLLQSIVIFILGFCIGAGLAAAFFAIGGQTDALKGFYMPWYILLITAGIVILVTLLASFFSMLRVLRLDPAIVFKG